MVRIAIGFSFCSLIFYLKLFSLYAQFELNIYKPERTKNQEKIKNTYSSTIQNCSDYYRYLIKIPVTNLLNHALSLYM